ncbi:ethylbenzene dehydrogenase-related protein [Balneolaceae bacterium ANBcel3]|nr:ethylbenzene dehydrogenase-related protein [Balneolaceae bacterium ANBcel3]
MGWSLRLLLVSFVLLSACNRDAVTDYETKEHDDNRPLFFDAEQNIYIPSKNDLLKNLDVAFVYNQDSIQVHFRFETDQPSWYHQYLVYEDGEWIRYGGGQPGPDPYGLYEDRISMMLDDESVEQFNHLGGFVTAHQKMRSRTDEIDSEKVASHPHLGTNGLNRSDIRKFIPESRDGEPDESYWARVQPEDRLDSLLENGVFLDLWQWRSHRSNPLGYADNGYVLEYRHSSSGTGMYTNNQDSNGDPLYMFDPDITGRHALSLDRLIAREYGQSDPYFIYEGNAVPFQSDIEWENGDAIPQRFLRTPEGSRGALDAKGVYEEGAWNVVIRRTRTSPDPLDSKEIIEGKPYHVAFSVHTNSSGARWHYVSVPYSLEFGDEVDADIQAEFVDGPLNSINPTWHSVPVFYPGQIDYSWLISPEHPGNVFVRDGSFHMLHTHQLELLTQFIVRQELLLLGEDPEEYGISPDVPYEP